MESPVPVVSNIDIPRVAEKSKKDTLEESGSQVSSGDDSFHESASDFGSANLVPDMHVTKPNLVLSQEVPEPELTTGSTGSSCDPKSPAPLTLIPASGPAGSSGKLAPDVHDDSARPWSPDAKNGSARPPADRSQSSSSSLKEFKTFFDLHDYTNSTSSRHDDSFETKISSQESKTCPELPDYDSQGSSSPGHLLESQPSSQEAKAYPDLASYDSQGSSSPGNVLESPPPSQEAKAYPDLPSYDSQGSPIPANWWETEKFGSDEKGPNLGNLVGGSVDLDPLAGRNWRKSVEAVPGIAPAVAHHEDSNSTELYSHTSSGSQSSSDSD